jgi:hypothetical protein
VQQALLGLMGGRSTPEPLTMCLHYSLVFTGLPEMVAWWGCRYSCKISEGEAAMPFNVQLI